MLAAWQAARVSSFASGVSSASDTIGSCWVAEGISVAQNRVSESSKEPLGPIPTPIKVGI